MNRVKSKKYGWIYVTAIAVLGLFFAFLFFCADYYNDYSHFGEEIRKYTDYYYVKDEVVTVQYNGRNYYLGAEEIGNLTVVVLRGGLISRKRMYFDKGDEYKDRPKMTILYDGVKVTLIDASDKKDVTFMIYEKENGNTKYYKLEKLKSFDNAVACLRTIN